MRSIRPNPRRATRKSRRRAICPGVWLLLILLGPAGGHPADPPPAPNPAPADPAARAERLYQAAAAAYERDPDNVTNVWQFCRATFDRAEFARDAAERAALAERGIAAARAALAHHTNVAALPYYLGMNLGQLARTKSLGALPLVREMESLFERARQLDEHFDEAGPDRNLGLLYLEAPGWPVSIGHRGRARQHLERALALAPDYPENHLNLLEARQRWGEKDLDAALRRLAELLPAARQRYTGEAWSAAWEDWERRWRAVQARAGAGASPATTAGH